MDTLLISNRVYLNSEQQPGFFSGGILISYRNGRINRIFSSLLAVDVYLLHNEAEVSVVTIPSNP